LNSSIGYFDNKLNEMVKFIERLVNFESPSSDKEACDRIINYVSSYMAEGGFKTELFPNRESGNCLKVTYTPGKIKKILLLSHLDTVWPLGTTKKRPFTMSDGKIWGPGVFDMKTGAAQAIYALKTYKAFVSESESDKEIALVFNTDEETGSSVSRWLIEKEAGSSNAVLVFEPSVSYKGFLKTSRKGVGLYELKVQGRASHAGADPEKGISAVEELAKQILQIKKLEDKPLGTTINFGLISGGTRVNVVPAEAQAMIEVRFKSKEEADRIHSQLSAIQPLTEGAAVQISGGINRPPMEETSQNVDLFLKAKEIGKALGIDIEASSTGGASDGNFTSALGVPTLDGLGAVGDDGHSESEHALIDKIPERTALAYELLRIL